METQGPLFELESSYTPTITEKGTILNLNLQSNVSAKSKEKYVLIVLDTSGSMSGMSIMTSRGAISEMIKMLFGHTQHPKVDLITFNNTPTFHQLQGKNEKECLEIVSKIKASGGTNFIPVFNMIKDILNKNISESSDLTKGVAKIDELAVVFLSDGQAERLDQLKPHIQNMKDFVEKNLSSAEFHTLGFGGDHDARLLGEMTKAMPTPGTFQYVKQSSEIKSCIEAVSGYLIEKRLSSYVTWNETGTLEKKVNFISQYEKKRKDGMEAYWEGTICLTKSVEEFEKIKESLKLHIKLEENFKVLDMRPVFKKPEGKAVEIHQNFFYINEELRKISDAIVSNEFQSKKAEEYRDTIAGLRFMLNELVKDVFKLKIDDRKLVVDAAKDLNEYMDKIGELLRVSANQGLTNDQIASINAMAYRQVTKKSHLKTLDKRALQNVDLINKVYEKAKEVSENINEKEFTEKHSTLINDIGNCALSLSNMTEALKNQDCLCMTFDIARPEIAIQDASRLIIKKIYPTIISASTFLDSINYSMALNPNNSGGFNTAFSGEIVKGTSNESITAAMPLYFCQEHWRSASEFIKPILGWDVTIDPLGYDYNQLRTVPFLLLVKALNEREENPNEFNSRMAQWLKETCCQIIKDEIESNPKVNLAETVKTIWEKYDLDGTVRGVESVQNNNVFLANVYCLQEMKLLQHDSQESFFKKFSHMIEEEMRRRQEKAKVWNGSQVRKNLKRILDIDIDHFVDLLKQEQEASKPKEPHKEEIKSEEDFDSKTKRFLNKFQQVQKNQVTKSKIHNKFEREEKNKLKAALNKEKNQEKDSDFRLTVSEDFISKMISNGLKSDNIFPLEFDKLNNIQKEYSTQAFQAYKNSIKFLKHWLKIWNYSIEGIEKIESIGLKAPLQLFALHIQNKIQHKNSDRLEAFQSNQYFNPFSSQDAEKYILKLASQIIFNKWTKEQNNKPKEMNRSIDDINYFVETDNLQAAAGMLLEGFNLGSFEHLQELIRREPGRSKNIFDKLLMLRHKEFQGVSFELDFKIRKKFARQLYKKYKDQYSYDQWKELWFREKPKTK